MKKNLLLYSLIFFSFVCLKAQQPNPIGVQKKSRKVILFNGKNLQYWEGDKNVWHIENGVITAGDTSIEHLQNDFLATKKGYKNFALKQKFKLEGGPGFINAGVQVNSQRNTMAPLNEMVGFQADIGPGFTGSLYDETRRNMILAKADSAIEEKSLHKNDWNNYEIRCIGRRIIIILNGTQTVDYTEPENDYPDFDKIG